MSLYGSLYTGVTGLSAQGSAIAIISDNIANINTVGYKAGSAYFSTLVTNSASVARYSPGGVLNSTQQLVDQQGILQSTNAPTDIAVSGDGFFVVSENVLSNNDVLYTRAGSFRQDNLGNFVNANGFYLQGWPLDRDGLLPGEPGNLNTTSSANLDSLETVNVQAASGTAAATTDVDLGINLDAGEVVFPGQEDTITMDINSANNFQIAADDIIVPDEYGLATTNSIYRQDQFRVTTGNGLQYDYEYGGFAIGRDITAANPGNEGDGGNAIQPLTLAGGEITTNAVPGGTTHNVNIPNHGLITGDTITIAGMAATDGIPAAEWNQTHTITYVDANNFTITTSTGSAAGSVPNAGTETLNLRQFTGNVMDASSATQAFLGTTGTAGFSSAALTFTVTNNTSGTVTFRYTTSSPNALAQEFNNLSTLATAIDEVAGLTARVVNGRLVAGAEDANEAVTFANGDGTGTPGTNRGIDWVTELDLQSVTAGSGRRFSTMQGLANLVNNDDGLSASVLNPLSDANVDILVDDPLDTITFEDLGASNPALAPFSIPNLAAAVTAPATAAGLPVPVTITNAAIPAELNVGDQVIITNETAGLGGLPGATPNGGPYTVTAVNPGADFTFEIPAAFNTAGVAAVSTSGSGNAVVSIVSESNQGSLLAEFGIANSLTGTSYLTAGPQTVGPLGPKYDSSGATGDNMASGDITAQFSRNIRVYDALGAPHDLRASFIKIDTNEWAVEVHAVDATEVSTTLSDGQVAVGTIQFNGDGSLRSVSSGLTNPVTINWNNGAATSTVTFNWGTAGQPFGTTGATTIGQTDGLSQFDADYNVAFVNQNGSPVGELISVSIDEEGFVISSFTNGESQRLYKLPLADFPNPNALKAITGNVFAETDASGDFNLRESGSNGVGTFVPAALETSNADLAEELTDMIIAQRAYQANTKVVSTSDELLEELNRL